MKQVLLLVMGFLCGFGVIFCGFMIGKEVSFFGFQRASARGLIIIWSVLSFFLLALIIAFGYLCGFDDQKRLTKEKSITISN